MEDKYKLGLQKNIDVIGKYFFIDPETKRIGGDIEVPHWNTTLLALSYIMDQNPLLVGEPGFAKTTAAKVVSSVMSGFPFDLYEAAQIQGHPDQTYETMIARPDFSKLSKEESVIWLLSAYLPVRIIDEINRLPGGNQDELLNALETGRFNYLNSTFYSGKTPFISTANHPDDGNHIMIPPLRDRFGAHIEIGYIGALYDDDIENARDNIRDELWDTSLTERIMGIVNNQSIEIKEKFEKIEEAKLSYVQKLETGEVGTTVFDNDLKREVMARIRDIPLSTEAKVLTQMINSELNSTPTFGRKRSNDPVDTSNHAQSLASTSVENGCSPRAIRAMKDYAKALAYLTGASEVGKEFIEAMAPHVLGHRVEFTPDFKGDWEEKNREGLFGEPKEMHFSRALVKKIESNYASVKQDIDLLVVALKNDGSLTEDQKARANDLLTATKIDHPLVKEYVHRFREIRPQGF
ncbi:AAA domain-containing protein [Candidatus Woesearchaeota archaeon]|jgi:MoxR-like ATPase|nr:AAA domain-containing protein [Candidatus Woesearchaeota archaeon]